jgi:glycosyltransferase involved in cell wall biosynthesis
LDNLVSIIVPCYNQAQFLEEALQSVLDQTNTNWECIIVNDGSPDHTEEIAKKWANSDLRFVYLKKENGGLSSARNLGLDNAKGEFIQFLDSDDILDNRKLELSIKELHFDKNVNIVISNFKMFTINHNYSTAPYCTLDFEFFNFKSILLKWESIFSIPIHCGLFGANLFQDFRFPEELKAKEDWIMWLSLFQKEFKVSFINTPLAYYRIHKKSMTNDAKYMLENHMKAIIYIRNIISEKDYIDYLYLELQQKYDETIKLRSTIYNYQNSLTYKLAEKIKATFLSKYFLKIIKK